MPDPLLALGAPLIDAVAANTPTEWIAPILSTGMVGIFLFMILLRIKIMPTYVYEDAKKEWERERQAMEARHAAERQDDRATIVESKQSLKDGTEFYTRDVIPLLTRLLDSERELVELRKAEARRLNRGGE